MGKSIPNENILELIMKTKSLLDECGIPYWLGRGVLGDFLVNGDIKCQHSDVDFHILDKDREVLKHLIPIFEAEKYKLEDKNHKLAFYKPDKRNPEYYLEFMYILPCKENRKIVYHISDNKKRYCPVSCFFENEYHSIEIRDCKMRIPNNIEDYFRMVYEDDNWMEKYKKTE